MSNAGHVLSPIGHLRMHGCSTPSPLVSTHSCFGCINVHINRAGLNTTRTFLRKVNSNSERVLIEYDEYLFGDGLTHTPSGRLGYDVSHSETELRAAKPNFHRGCLAPALESRGANLRPRKLDEKLSRDVARARRVALLAPRATLTQYRHPLGYVSAITKIFGKVQKLVPHFGRSELYSEWGRSPVGEVGDFHSHVRGQDFIPKGRRGFLTSLSEDVTRFTLSEHGVPFERARPNTPHPPNGRILPPPSQTLKNLSVS